MGAAHISFFLIEKNFFYKKETQKNFAFSKIRGHLEGKGHLASSP
jgi:hypothetical protein